MQAEIPQPISGVPFRWGGFTGRQLAWVMAGAAVPYLLLRLQLTPELALASAAPWLVLALLFGFGRREGRSLDCWVGDWLWFQIQPHHLHHPRSTSADRYVTVDSEVQAGDQGMPELASVLTWVAPWP
ncbi:MAG TPA: PrgI family protein [Candidatus Micrarchaeaceae archaeon]|nr:PrgI family protein [Candidatus Micrarchaeaceae archaeon]